MRTICANSTTSDDSRPPRAAIVTVGCRLNQSESDALRAQLHRQGIAIVASPAAADVVFVNTCTVTAAADRSSLAMIRRAGRLAHAPRIVVLGCLAERAPARLQGLPGVVEVWDNRRKQEFIAGAVPAPGRTRALLKVQDGCSRRCGYCVVAQLRGPERSVPAAELVPALDRLVAAGYREVVLTGLNLGAWRDSVGNGLAGLVARLLERPGRFRLRLGSLEPDTVDDALLGLLGHEKLCPHLHLPLQTADDWLLARLGRPGGAADFERLCDEAVRRCPDVALGVDVIAGLPGETEESFQITRQFIADLPLAYLHAFSFSPRPGTPAAALPGRIPTAVVRQRVRRLRELGDRHRAGFAARFAGQVRMVLAESGQRGLTDNYLRVRLTGPAVAGELQPVRLEAGADGLTGKVVDNPKTGQ